MSDAKVSAVDELCTACGLCCNGVLFGDVELQPGDAARRLAELGLPWQRQGRKQKAGQPCACFEGKLCRIYAERPIRCRTFECRLLARAQRGEIETAAALRAIRQVRRDANEVRRLLRQLGQTDEQLPLNQRYAKMMAKPIDLAGDEGVIEVRSELMLAVHRLVQALERDFL